MKLFDSIDGLLAGTRYLAWGIALVGIAASIALVFVNIPLGMASAATFLAAFFLAIGVALVLLPKKLAIGKLEGNRRVIAGIASLTVAFFVMMLVWVMNGGFPAVNLIFI